MNNNETMADILSLDFNTWRDVENLAGNMHMPQDLFIDESINVSDFRFQRNSINRRRLNN